MSGPCSLIYLGPRIHPVGNLKKEAETFFSLMMANADLCDFFCFLFFESALNCTEQPVPGHEGMVPLSTLAENLFANCKVQSIPVPKKKKKKGWEWPFNFSANNSHGEGKETIN